MSIGWMIWLWLGSFFLVLGDTNKLIKEHPHYDNTANTKIAVGIIYGATLIFAPLAFVSRLVRSIGLNSIRQYALDFAPKDKK